MQVGNYKSYLCLYIKLINEYHYFLLLYCWWTLLKTNAFFFWEKQRLIQSLRTQFGGRVCKGKDLSLHFVPDKECIPKTTENLLPVIIGDQNSKLVSFDWKKYMECLQTKVLGHILLYTEVITSTQVVLDGLVCSALVLRKKL